MRGFMAIGLAAGVLAGASARAAESACSAFAWPLARELVWLSAANLPAVDSGGAAPSNAAVAVTLRPMEQVALAITPERAPKSPASYGAVVKISDPGKAGLYQITLSEEAWVDVVQGDARVHSAAFSGKPGCPGMRKSVRFSLASAPFVVQISGSPVGRLNMAVAPAE